MLKSKKSKKVEIIIQMVIVVAILIIVNLISIRIFGRIDLTRNGVYTLSEASRNLVRAFNDRVSVKAFFTEDLPSPYNNNRRAVLDILNEYRAYAGSNLYYEFINPEGEKAEQEARQQGIPPVEVQVVKEDKFEVKRAYLGLVLMYEDRKEVIPVVQNLSTLEFDLSSAMKRLTSPTKKAIYYSSGYGEPDFPSLQLANRAVSAQYTVMPVDLKSGVPVPSDAAALLVIAPDKKLGDTARFQIDQYLMRGGKIAFLLNAMNPNLRYGMAQPQETGLEAQLEQYGVRLNRDLVRDERCATVSVPSQFGFPVQIPFYYAPAASKFHTSNIIVKDLQNVIFYFVSSVDTNLAGAKGLSTEVLVRTSQHSGRQAGMIMIDPMHRYTPEELSEDGIPLAALVQGKFKGAFSGWPGALSASPETRIVVVGDGDFMRDDVARNPGNLAFFANIIDYLADDAGLITIRTKNVAMAPLDPVSDATKRTVKYTNLILPPLVVIGYGIFRWRMRKARRKALETTM